MKLKHRLRILITTLAVCLWALSAWLPNPVQAQTSSGQQWTPPLNLSNAGGAETPQVFTDTEGTVHALWQDRYAGFFYTRSADGMTWDAPTPLDLPFHDTMYQMLPGKGDTLHTLWIRDDGMLMFTSAPMGTLGIKESWGRGTPLARKAVRFWAAVDAEGRVHVTFLRVEDSNDGEAGVYYLRSTPGGSGWNQPVLIYSSPYLRTLLNPDARMRALNATDNLTAPVYVHITTALVNDSVHVFIGWDNPALKRAFYARSVDGGAAWEPAVEVEGPNAATPYSNAGRARIYANASQVIVTWQVVESGGACTQKYIASQDGGDTWRKSGVMLDGYSACPDQLQSFVIDGDQSLFLAAVQNQTLLLAWNGQQWSRPQLQNRINSFEDGNNFSLVKFGCQTAEYSNARMRLIGCDQGEGSDIWYTQSDLEPTTDWFTPERGWERPATVALAGDAPPNFAFSADSNGSASVLWSQISDSARQSIQNDLNIATWNQANGAQGPFTVFSQLEGVVNQIALTSGADDRLYAMWAGGTAGEAVFSWANAAQVANQAGWSPPIYPQAGRGLSRSPSLTAAEDGGLLAVYAVPVNQQRGIYAITSADHGKTWTEPGLIYDAAQSECGMVDQPAVARMGSVIQVTWICSTPPGGVGALALYGSQSRDKGQTWSEAQSIRAAPVTWDQLLTTGEVFHRLWKEVTPKQTLLWHSLSSDQGSTWSKPENFLTVETSAGATAVTAAPNATLHLVQVTQDARQSPALLYLMWDGTGWTPRASAVLAEDATARIGAVHATVAGQHLVVAYATQGDANAQIPSALSFITYQDDLGGQSVSPIATPVAQAQATSTAPVPTEPPAALQASATPQDAALLTDPPASSSSTVGLLIGAFVALVIVSIVFVLSLTQKRPQRY